MLRHARLNSRPSWRSIFERRVIHCGKFGPGGWTKRWILVMWCVKKVLKRSRNCGCVVLRCSRGRSSEPELGV